MTLQELQKLRDSIDALIQEKQSQEQPEKPRLERWKPKHGGYFYVASVTQAYKKTWDNLDNSCFDAYNCFETYEQAEKEALRTRARRKLEWLARELNGNKKGYASWYIGYDLLTIEELKLGQMLPLSLPRFIEKADAEYALSQMTAEELEALR